jgi:hypothetical protein
VRIHGLYLALLLGAGCGQPDTIVRLTVRLGHAPTPEKLRVSVYGPTGVLTAAKTLSPVPLPGVIVIDRVDPSLPELCVALEGEARDGTITSRGAVTVGIVPYMTANAAIELGDTTMLGCTLGGDGGSAPHDLGGSGARDLATHDLTAQDLLGVVPICPANAIFCDDFESGDVSKWTEHEIHFDGGAQLEVQATVARHGKYALHATATGHDMAGQGRSVVVKTLPGVMPPIAVRANVFAVQPLDHYGVTVEIYDSSYHGFAVSGDNQDVWTVTEDQTQNGAVDRHADMVPFNAGAWHCVEIVVDNNGFVSLFIDNHQLVTPFLRMSAVSYATLQVGIGRTINPTNDVYVDDVAVAPTRLYCP